MDEAPFVSVPQTEPFAPSNLIHPSRPYSCFSQSFSCIVVTSHLKLMIIPILPTVKSSRETVKIRGSELLQVKLNLVGHPVSNSVLFTPFIVAVVLSTISPLRKFLASATNFGSAAVLVKVSSELQEIDNVALSNKNTSNSDALLKYEFENEYDIIKIFLE